MSEKSIGEFRVRTDFNVSGSGIVDSIKTKTADLINDLQVMREVKPEQEESKNGEILLVSGEKLRLIALAQTTYEEAAMWAVKAATA